MLTSPAGRNVGSSSRRQGWPQGWLIFVGITCGVILVGADSAWDPEVQRLVGALTGPVAEVDAAIVTLAQMRERAIPALERGLEDPAIQSACADTLTRMPPHLAAPPLKSAIERAPTTTSQERRWKSFLIGALGQLRSRETVPYLEELYTLEDNKTDQVAMSIAWALKNVTGREYGPTSNPWDGCRQYVADTDQQGSAPVGAGDKARRGLTPISARHFSGLRWGHRTGVERWGISSARRMAAASSTSSSSGRLRHG